MADDRALQAAIPRPAGWNKFCNSNQLEAWLSGTPLLDFLYSGANNLPPLDNVNNLAAFPLYYLIARGECRYRNKPSIDNSALTIASANMLMPYLDTKQANQENANKLIRTYILSLLCYEAEFMKHFEIPAVDYAAWREAHVSFPETLTGYTPEILDALIANRLIVARDAVSLLELCYLHKKPVLSTEATRLAVALFVALSKRGAITSEKCDRINEAIKEDGLPDPRISPELIKLLYNNCGAYVTGENAQATFTYLSSLLIICTLRVRLTVSQASGSGLTTLIAIRDALNKFKTFNWGEIVRLLRLDCERYAIAAQLVGNNLYYGFTADLGRVRSTEYKSLGYVAFNLLIKYGGPSYSGLVRYAGITRNPLSKAALDILIDNYNPDLELSDMTVDQVTAGVEALRTASALNTDL